MAQPSNSALDQWPVAVFTALYMIAAASMGLGTLNEVVEFFATLLVPETNVGGYINTGWDLVANAVGAAIAASIIWILSRTANPHSD